MNSQDLRAKRLSEAIAKSGYTYAELEKLTGISKSSLQRYATGETKKVPIDCIEIIAKITKKNPKYLACMDEWDKESDAFEEDFNNRNELMNQLLSDYLSDPIEKEIATELIRSFPRLNKDGLKKLVERLEELVRFDEYKSETEKHM